MWEYTWELWEDFPPALTYVKEVGGGGLKKQTKKPHHEWKCLKTQNDLAWAENED